MRHLIPDLSFSIRLFRRHPVETALAVAAIVLGVGLSTAMFSILWGTVLRGLPFKDSERLARIESISHGERVAPAAADFLAWRRGQRTFDGVAAWLGSSFNLSVPGGVSERYNGAFVSTNTFQLLQARPLLGRNFQVEDEALGAPMVAIISARTWRDQLHRDPDILGKLIKLNGQSAQVIGVMPEGFGFPLSQDVWTPLQLDPKPVPPGQELHVQAFGKLRDGISRHQAEANLAATFPQDSAPRLRNRVAVTPFVTAYTEDLQPTLYLLFGASLGLLLVVAANISGLLTAQTIARLPELAIRSAVGATRSRLLLQLVAETSVLAVIGTALSVPLASAAIHAYIASQGGELRSFWMDVRLDLPVIAYALALTIFVVFTSTAIPALRVTGSRLDETLKRGAGKGAASPAGAGSGFRLVLQLALSFALLAATGSIIDSLGRLRHFDFGFAPEQVLSAQVLVPYDGYPAPADKLRFLDTLEGHLEEAVGPGQAAFASALPGNAADEAEATIQGQQPLAPDAPKLLVQTLTVSRNYFKLLHIPASQGRLLEAGDRSPGAAVVVVNRSFARHFFGNNSPLGTRLRLGPPQEDSPWRTIVGVVPDFVIGKVPAPHPEGVYLPLAQNPSGWMAILLRTPKNPLGFTKVLKLKVAATDPEVPTFWVQTLQTRSDGTRQSLKTMAEVFLVLGSTALFLSLLGIYGVTSRNVASRSREMAVRLTLGARKADLLRLVLRSAFAQVLLGIGLGGLLSVGTSRFLSSLLFDFQGWEPWVFWVVVCLLALAGMLACLIPASAVLRVQPVEVLREA
jgi:predicted permease